jgi:hypothetical protein
MGNFIMAIFIDDVFKNMILFHLHQNRYRYQALKYGRRFRNRSNSRPYFMGSISVILRQNATADPAADPLPGPTETPISLAARRKSWTIRKYPGKPILAIISNSKSSLLVCSFVNVPHLFFSTFVCQESEVLILVGITFRQVKLGHNRIMVEFILFDF